MVRTSRRHLLVAAAASLGPWRAEAQSSRPIRILVGFAAGGGNDLIARILAQKLSDGGLGPVLVENRTGASGLIAADLLAKSAPDVQQRFGEISLSVNPSSPEELDVVIKAEALRWAEVIRRAGIRAPE